MASASQRELLLLLLVLAASCLSAASAAFAFPSQAALQQSERKDGRSSSSMMRMRTAAAVSSSTCRWRWRSQGTYHYHSSSSSSRTALFGRASAVREKTKSKTDLRKAKIYAQYGKKILMAAKGIGGGDLSVNRILAELVASAKRENVPADNIARAIKKGSSASSASTDNYVESVFECYGFSSEGGGGSATFVINVLTDNGNRAAADVKSTVKKNDGKVAQSGSVLFSYDKKGCLKGTGKCSEEQLLEVAIDAGCDDMEFLPYSSEDDDKDDDDEEVDGGGIVYVAPGDLSRMKEAMKAVLKLDPITSFVHVPKAPVMLSDVDYEANLLLIEALEALDDVDSVEHNMLNE
jgi:YebC/PmpR family DNA-binding regulatory protein